jgi:uncharacterized iron-regulated membrane protein
VHLWCGIGLGLYVFFISVTGSVLVYRNELYVVAAPEPVAAGGSVARSDAYPVGMFLVDKLIELHDDLLGGQTGRTINGAAAAVVILICLTGPVIWWPGIALWRRGLTVHRGVGWRRFTWELHGALGIWTVLFLLVLATSGLYFCFPTAFDAFLDWIEPPTDANAGKRWVDGALYWLAYLHFGRINGIGIPCSGPGVCDQTTKAVWATLGLVPAAMFVTGFVMWWSRVVRRRLRARRTRGASPPPAPLA